LSGLRTIAEQTLVVNFEAFHKLQELYDDVDKSVYFNEKTE